MKREQIGITILAFAFLIAIIWISNLYSRYNDLKKKKIELEMRLTRVIKDRDFLRTQLEDLEKRLKREVEERRSLSDQLEEAKNRIEELQKEIFNLTQAKQELETELKFKEGISIETPGPVQEGVPSALEEVIPF